MRRASHDSVVLPITARLGNRRYFGYNNNVPQKPDFRPSKAELEAARGKRVPDLVGPGLSVLFCGINPSLYSAAVRHHFARPGNRFWKTLERAGFTDRLLAPHEERELLQCGVGITNVVARATVSAAELTRSDYLRGARELARKVKACRPRFLAFVGITAYRIAADAPAAQVGLQSARFAGARVWVLPNPSGLNAHYQLPELTRVYTELARAAGFVELSAAKHRTNARATRARRGSSGESR